MKTIKNLLLVILVIIGMMSCTKEYNYYYTTPENPVDTVDIYDNTIYDYQNITDGDYDTYGYIAMDDWDSTFTGNLYLDVNKTISQLNFKYGFPNTDVNNCTYYQGQYIYYEARVNLYYKSGKDWILLQNSDNLPTFGPECEMVGEITYNFEPKEVSTVKVEMVGVFWLGGAPTTYFKLFELNID